MAIVPEDDSPQLMLIPCTKGLFQCMLTQQGHFMYCMEAYYQNINVSRAVLINDDEVLVSLQDIEDQSQCRLVILNLDTREEKIVLKPDNAIYCIDICKIPSRPDLPLYVIMKTVNGIQLVDTQKQRHYDIATNKSNF